MRRFRGPIALLLAAMSIAASNPVLVPDVSQRKVEIVYSFTGAELLLFGAIIYPGGRVPTEDADIVVVLRGPSEPLIVREKRKLGGIIWANTESSAFRSVPTFYALASSKPINKLVDQRTAAIYELGLKNLQLSPASGDSSEVQARFSDGLVKLRQKFDLFKETRSKVEIDQGVLYRARLSIPARVPVGIYTAETFLIRNGRVLAAATRDIEITKSGLERFVAESAERWPFAYGLTAILMSLLFGWSAARIFRKF